MPGSKKQTSPASRKTPRSRKPPASKPVYGVTNTIKRGQGAANAYGGVSKAKHKGTARPSTKAAARRKCASASKTGIKNDKALCDWVRAGADQTAIGTLPYYARLAASHLVHVMCIVPVDVQVRTSAGIIDLVGVCKTTGQHVVVDLKCMARQFRTEAEFKTHYKSVPPTGRRTIAFYNVPNTLEATHSIQIASYRLALRDKLQLPYIPRGFVLMPLLPPMARCMVHWCDDSYLHNPYIIRCIQEATQRPVSGVLLCSAPPDSKKQHKKQED